MAVSTRHHQDTHSAYAGLDFIKAAFCPLDFKAMPFRQHPDWKHLGADEGLGVLQVGDQLRYARRFPYTDQHGNRRSGTQMTTALFGLAPVDFDLFLGLFTYLKRLPELPKDGLTYLTADFIARQLKLPATCQKDYLRIRSRLFRLSYVKYTNSTFWNPEHREYDIVNFGFYNLKSLSRMTESRRPIILEWDRSLLSILERTKFLTFDYDFYRSLSPALRRLYLIANRDGWNQPHSGIFLADDFTIHQIGYSDDPSLSRLRMQKLKKLLASAEDADIIRPYQPWRGYFQTITTGRDKGKTALRWTRGPLLRQKPAADGRRFTDRIENDALYAQTQELKDEDGHPMTPQIFRTLVSKHGREKIQKHVAVILAQKEHHPGSFQRSEIAAFINRLQHDHAEPDWYQDLKRAERLSLMSEVQPNQLSLDMYKTFFQE